MRLGNKIIAKTFDEIIKVLADVMVLKAEDIVTINQTKLPAYVVQERFRELDSSHMEYLVNALSENESKRRNVRAFILTTAYNVPALDRNENYGEINDIEKSACIFNLKMQH